MGTKGRRLLLPEVDKCRDGLRHQTLRVVQNMPPETMFEHRRPSPKRQGPWTRRPLRSRSDMARRGRYEEVTAVEETYTHMLAMAISAPIDFDYIEIWKMLSRQPRSLRRHLSGKTASNDQGQQLGGCNPELRQAIEANQLLDNYERAGLG